MVLSIEIKDFEFSNESFAIYDYEVKEINFTDDHKIDVVYQLKLKPETVNIKFKVVSEDE